MVSLFDLGTCFEIAWLMKNSYRLLSYALKEEGAMTWKADRIISAI